MDVRALAFTLAVALGANLLFGLMPALQTAKVDHAGTLKEGHGRGGGGRSRRRLSRGLVVGEIALSMVCLGVGAMLIRRFLEIRSSSPGFDGRDVLVATMVVPQTRYPEDEDRLFLVDRVLERVAVLPGVLSVALVNALPQGLLPPSDSIRIPGEESPGGDAGWNATRIAASPGHLEAMDIPLPPRRTRHARHTVAPIPPS